MDPAGFSRDHAEAINALMADPERRHRMAKGGRQRAVDRFNWTSIAHRVKALYDTLVKTS